MVLGRYLLFGYLDPEGRSRVLGTSTFVRLLKTPRLSTYLSIYPSTYLPTYLPTYLSMHLAIYLSVQSLKHKQSSRNLPQSQSIQVGAIDVADGYENLTCLACSRSTKESKGASGEELSGAGVYIYIYIYIYLSLSLSLYIYVYKGYTGSTRGGFVLWAYTRYIRLL